MATSTGLGEPKGKQRRFADEYLLDLDGAAAYRRAGYRVKDSNVAAACASRLLGTARVAAYVAKKQAKHLDRYDVTAERVIRELAIVGFSDLRDYTVDAYGHVALGEGETGRAVQSIKRRVQADEDGNETIETEIKLWEKTSALQMLGRHLKLFTDVVEVRGDLADRLKLARERARSKR